MLNKLALAEERFEEICQMLYDPAVIADLEQYSALLKEHKNLEPIITKFREYKSADDTLKESRAMLDEGGLDKDFREMVQEEYELAKESSATLYEELKILLLPKDPNDDKNVIVEIRGGAGGQHVNKTESAIRIIHIPTGTIVECQDERSQHKNKDKAMKILRSKILEAEKEKQMSSIADERKSQVGTGDRSERIRTYNYPQGRISDHRIGLTVYKLEQFLNGDLDEVIDALITYDTAQKLKSEN